MRELYALLSKAPSARRVTVKDDELSDFFLSLEPIFHILSFSDLRTSQRGQLSLEHLLTAINHSNKKDFFFSLDCNSG